MRVTAYGGCFAVRHPNGRQPLQPSARRQSRFDPVRRLMKGVCHLGMPNVFPPRNSPTA